MKSFQICKFILMSIVSIAAAACGRSAHLSSNKDVIVDPQKPVAFPHGPAAKRYHCISDFECTKDGHTVTGTIDSGSSFFDSDKACNSDLGFQLLKKGVCSGSEIKFPYSYAYDLETDVMHKLIQIPGLVRYHNDQGAFIGQGVCAIRIVPNRHAQFLKRVVNTWSIPKNEFRATHLIYGIPDQSFLEGCEISSAAPRSFGDRSGCTFSITRKSPGLSPSLDILRDLLRSETWVDNDGRDYRWVFGTVDVDVKLSECNFKPVSEIIKVID